MHMIIHIHLHISHIHSYEYVSRYYGPLGNCIPHSGSLHRLSASRSGRCRCALEILETGSIVFLVQPRKTHPKPISFSRQDHNQKDKMDLLDSTLLPFRTPDKTLLESFPCNPWRTPIISRFPHTRSSRALF